MARQDNAFKLKKGLINLTDGIRKYTGENKIYLCVEDGSLELKFHDDTTETVDMLAGYAFMFEWDTDSKRGGVKTIEIKSGKFHIGD